MYRSFTDQIRNKTRNYNGEVANLTALKINIFMKLKVTTIKVKKQINDKISADRWLAMTTSLIHWGLTKEQEKILTIQEKIMDEVQRNRQLTSRKSNSNGL